MKQLGLRAYGCALLAVVVSSASLSAIAQQPTSNKIAAEALFDRGLVLLKEGKLPEACAKLEESQRLEAGIGTQLYLAECYERLGRIASAWALFREAASAAGAEGQTERAQTGAARANALEPRLPKLKVRLVASEPIEGLELLRNGELMQSALVGIDVPVDPGEHRIEARAPGRRAWSTVISVQESTARVVDVPALEIDPNAQVAATPEAAPSAASVQLAASDPHTRGGSVQPMVGIIVGAAGVVAIGIGSYFGLSAISKKDDADSRCEAAGMADGSCADARGVELNEQAQDAATLANVFVIGGAVLATAGIVLYLTAPASEGPSVALSSNGVATRLMLEGAF